MFKLRSVLADYALIGFIFCIGESVLLSWLFHQNILNYYRDAIGFTTQYTSWLPSELSVVASGIIVAGVLLAFMAIGMFIDMLGMSNAASQLGPFLKHLDQNMTWWSSFEKHFHEYIGDSSILREAAKSPKQITIYNRCLLKDGTISKWTKGRYIFACWVVSLVASFVGIPRAIRTWRIANMQYRRIEAFLLSFVMNYADATKGEIITDDIRVWRMSKMLANVAGLLILQILGKYGYIVFQKWYVASDDDKQHPLLFIWPLLIVFFVPLIVVVIVERTTTGFIATRAYSRYWISLFAATYVGYMQYRKSSPTAILPDVAVESQPVKSAIAFPFNTNRKWLISTTPLGKLKNIRVFSRRDW
ncbi:MAG: hypothetical protein ACYC26_13540 [Phycisphaerales bacterium]